MYDIPRMGATSLALTYTLNVVHSELAWTGKLQR